MTLDLHGVKHQDVKPILDKFIWNSMKKNLSHIIIITGNSEDMKSIVKETAIEYGFEAKSILSNTQLTIDLI